MSRVILFLGLASFLCNSRGLALLDEVNVGVGKWHNENNQPILVVTFDKHLTKKQRNLIDSGFSTFSSLRLSRNEDDINDEKMNLFKVSCTVVYDTWQERYDLARIDDTVSTTRVKSFKDYADQCLTAKIREPELIKTLSSGGSLFAAMQINQISISKAVEIKQWLIRQQTGVMQGLFSHMLGDLKLLEKTTVQIQIPASDAPNKGAAP